MDVIFDKNNCVISFESDTNNITILHSQGILNDTNIAIGSDKVGNGVSNSTEITHYYWKIYNNNLLIRDYIPVIRNSDHVVGLFDKVNFTFNSSTGLAPFTYEN